MKNNTFLSNLTTSSKQGAFMGRRLWALIGFGLLVFLAACSSAPAVGTLQVNITGLPSGVNASVKVTGTGFSQDLTASTPLGNRTVGSYTVTAADVTSGGLTYTGTVTGNPATVTANTISTVTVTYAVSPASLGTLQVNLVVPGGGNGNVNISGPNGFSRNITSTTTLSGLVPGAYTLTAVNVPGVGTSADLILAGTVSGATTVEANKTATATVTYAATTGTIKITVNGLPAGVEADIVVTRADNAFQQIVTGAATLTGLAPNNYFITVRNVRVSGAIVDTVFVSSSGDELSIGAGQVRTKVVTYTQRGGTGSLWVPVFGSIAGFSDTQLAPTGPVTAARVEQANFNQAVVFDANGNMYVSNTTNTISIYTPAQLAAGGAQTPRTLTSTALNSPAGMAFDSRGNLWVTNFTVFGTATNDRLVSFTAAQLAEGGTQASNKTITGSSLFDPVGLAFDSAGNLWVSNASAASESLVMFNSDQLIEGGSLPRARAISNGNFNRPFHIAFDRNGTLWVANRNGGSITGLVLSFTRDQLNAGGNQSSNVTLTGGGVGPNPQGLAFDKGGNLWVLSSGGFLAQIAAANLTTSGSPAFTTSLSGIGSISAEGGGGIAFSPTPSNLSINNK